MPGVAVVAGKKVSDTTELAHQNRLRRVGTRHIHGFDRHHAGTRELAQKVLEKESSTHHVPPVGDQMNGVDIPELAAASQKRAERTCIGERVCVETVEVDDVTETSVQSTRTEVGAVFPAVAVAADDEWKTHALCVGNRRVGSA